jgi:hypothetical protein
MLSLLLAGWLSVGWFSDFFDNPIQTVADTITNNIETVAVVAAAVATDGFSLGATEGAAAAIDYGVAFDSTAAVTGSSGVLGTVSAVGSVDAGFVDYGAYLDSTAGSAQYAVDAGAFLDTTSIPSPFSSFTLTDAARAVKTGADLWKLVNGTTIAQAATPPARPAQLGMVYYPPALSSNPSFGIARGWQAAAPAPAATPQWYETTVGQLIAGAAVAGGLVLFAKNARG